MDRRRQNQSRVLAAAVSLLAHGALLFAVLSLPGKAPAPLEETPPITVELVDLPSLLPDPTPAPAAPAKAAPARAAPPPQRIKPRPTPPRAAALTLPSAPPEVEPRLTEAQLAGATVAGAGSGGGSGGGGGGVCDMPARVQAALRQDPLVRTAVAGLGGKAALVWNGDWVRSGREDGKGLAAVREAMMWEVGFAPPERPAQPVHGLILFALGGGVKVVVGTGQWRWSDMLRSHGGGPVEGASWR